MCVCVCVCVIIIVLVLATHDALTASITSISHVLRANFFGFLKFNKGSNYNSTKQYVLSRQWQVHVQVHKNKIKHSPRVVEFYSCTKPLQSGHIRHRWW